MKVLLILLTILKVIGIIIAAIAALVLILLALVLFVPVRYSAKASYDRKPDISVRISYLLHILSVRFDLHDGNNEFIIKILGHRSGNRKKKLLIMFMKMMNFPDRKLPINRKLTMSDRRKIKKMFSKT